jgi:hypothetical protein
MPGDPFKSAGLRGACNDEGGAGPARSCNAPTEPARSKGETGPCPGALMGCGCAIPNCAPGDPRMTIWLGIGRLTPAPS